MEQKPEKKLRAKLQLKKETLVQLSENEMDTAKGGFTSLWDCTGWTCHWGSTVDDTYGCLCVS